MIENYQSNKKKKWRKKGLLSSFYFYNKLLPDFMTSFLSLHAVPFWKYDGLSFFEGFLDTIQFPVVWLTFVKTISLSTVLPNT